ITITLPNVIAKYNERGEKAIDELEEHIKESLRIMNQKYELTGKEAQIYPVIRATSFPEETKSGLQLVTKEHTAETRIYYALDLGKSYRLIDEPMLEKEGDRKSTRLNSSHVSISYADLCLKKNTRLISR